MSLLLCSKENSLLIEWQQISKILDCQIPAALLRCLEQIVLIRDSRSEQRREVPEHDSHEFSNEPPLLGKCHVIRVLLSSFLKLGQGLQRTRDHGIGLRYQSFYQCWNVDPLGHLGYQFWIGILGDLEALEQLNDKLYHMTISCRWTL